ncbi:MAG: ferredoxin family protein [Acidobacteria bacterium]|nr:ferredoxin family protein [Acidobacteriota bacterium]
MAGRAYLGIPRSMIPWAPRIDEDACIGCGECLETCANGVFVLDEVEEKMRVAAPDNCVVLCDKCAALCATDAITFPDKGETRALLQRLVRETRTRVAEATQAEAGG